MHLVIECMFCIIIHNVLPYITAINSKVLHLLSVILLGTKPCSKCFNTEFHMFKNYKTINVHKTKPTNIW